MKKIFIFAVLICTYVGNAQAFKGKGDTKLNLGLTVQDGGTGIVASTDFGLGENISLGLLASYLIGGNYIKDVPADYRYDVKFRFNANLGNVINIDPNFDFYPGLNIGVKNFGGHLGARYFFSEGFGMFTEFSVPIAKYDTDAMSRYNNGASFNIGAAFNF